MSFLTQAIKPIPGISPNDIPDTVLVSHNPVILKGLVVNWPSVEAAKKSTEKVISYLQKFSTKESWTVFKGEPEIDGRVFYNTDLTGFNFKVVGQSFKEIAAELKQYLNQDEAPMLYVGSTMIDRWLPGFRAENDIKIADHNALASIWMGNRSRIAAHYDFASNIACCVAGRRKFTLFPPDQLENLYVGPLDFTPAGQPISLVDFKNPDFKKFPKFRKALKSAIEVELEPGDALLIPSMWWHHVEALEDFNVLVNYWWRNSPRYMGSPLNVLQHAVLGLRDLPSEQRKVWQKLFEYYVFEPNNENFKHIPQHAKGVLNEMNEQMSNEIRNLLLDRLKR
jgi:hypothetical protein